MRTCQACRSAQDDGLEPPQEEQRFLDVLAKLKTRDGALYASSGPLFPEASGSGDDAGERPERSAKRQKVLTLATVNAQQARFIAPKPTSVSATLMFDGKGSAVATGRCRHVGGVEAVLTCFRVHAGTGRRRRL